MALWLSLFPTPVLAQWFGDLATETLANSNLPRALESSDEFADSGLRAEAHAGYRWQPGEFTGLSAGAAVSRSQYLRYSGVSNTEIRLDARLSHKFGIGSHVPVASLALAVSRAQFNNEIRDAWNYSSALILNQRVGNRLGLALELRYDYTDGDHNKPKPGIGKPGSAWDQRSWNLGLQAEWDLNEVSWLSLRHEFRSGDIVSSGLPYARVAGAAKAITLDTAFGAHTVAYRIDARTNGLAFDFNRVIGRSGTVYVGVEHQETRGTMDIDYGVTLARLGYIRGF